jgi:hypothetical protein
MISLCQHDLLGSGDRYQYAWFFCVGHDLWLFSWHSHCHTKEVCNQISLHNLRGFVSSKVVVHNNYRRKHIQLQWWIKQCSFVSWRTKKQGIFQEVGKYLKSSFYLFCNRHNRNPDSQ